MMNNENYTASEAAMVAEPEKITQFYQKAIEKHGDRSLMAARWSSEEKALSLYQGISHLPQHNWQEIQSVLDIGSGQGYFLQFLREQQHFQGKYVGLEFLPEFDRVAKQLYGHDPQAEFVCGEFLSYPFPGQTFDWIFSIGSLSPKKKDQESFDRAFTDKMAQLANRGFSLFLNDIKYIAPSRLEQAPDLAVHNVDRFAADLEQRFPGSQVSIVHYPQKPSQHSFVHVVL